MTVATAKKLEKEVKELKREVAIIKATLLPGAKLTSAQKRDLVQARKEYQKGEYSTLSQLERELAGKGKRKS